MSIPDGLSARVRAWALSRFPWARPEEVEASVDENGIAKVEITHVAKGYVKAFEVKVEIKGMP